MGPLGWQETVVIFVLALLLFGPKKLPELGKTIGKAITEFRRASSELKATFDREMSTIEREGESLREVTQQYTNEIQSNSYDSYYDSPDYDQGTYDSSDDSTSQPSAAATQGAESTATTQNGTTAIDGSQNGTETASVKKESEEVPAEPVASSDSHLNS